MLGSQLKTLVGNPPGEDGAVFLPSRPPWAAVGINAPHDAGLTGHGSLGSSLPTSKGRGA